MGYRKDWDMNAIECQLWRMMHECSSPYNDGFTAFEVKKDLLKLKFLINDLLERTPKFAGEEELYHQRMVDKLKWKSK